MGDQAGVIKYADRDEHDLKTLEFYFMEVHITASISRTFTLLEFIKWRFISQRRSRGGLHDDKHMDLCGVSYRGADTQRDELTRCSS